MNEAKAKETKNCDAKSLAAIKKIMVQGSPARATGEQILNRITQFITQNENATFAREGEEYFNNEASFASAIKKCDPSQMERQFIQSVAQQVNQRNIAGEGKASIEQGEILRAVSDANNATHMLPFFPYFKLLFKLCQLGMTLKKRQSLEMKQVSADVYIKDKKVSATTAESQVGNLSFHEKISEQVNRTMQQDIAALVSKQERLRREIERTQAHTTDEFRATYLSSIVGQ